MKIYTSVLLIIGIALPSLCTGAVRSDKDPRILIIGDSISIGFTPFVMEMFQGRAEVFHNPGNAQHTRTGLEMIELWLGDEDWDLIHFNWGLWDLCYRHSDGKRQGKKDKEKEKKTKKELLFMTPIDKSMTVDEIYLKLIKLLEKNGVKVKDSH